MRAIKKSSFLLTILVFCATTVWAQSIQKATSANYQKGLDLYENGYFENAIEAFELFKKENTKLELNEAADFQLALSHAASDSANIEYYYQNFINKYPTSQFSIELLKDIGHRYIAMADYEGALHFYERILPVVKDHVSSEQTHYWIAEAYANNGDHQTAREYFLKLADEYPKSEWAANALYARGRLYLSDEKYDHASEEFEILKERYPNAEITRKVGTALGESYYQQALYEEAIDALQEAYFYLDDESKAKALFLIGESYNVLDDFEEAKKAYLQYANFTKGTPEARNAHYGLGWLYNKQEIYHWAAEEFGKAAEGDDELARKALYYQAVNLKLTGQYEKSYRTFEEFSNQFKTGFWVEEAMYEWSISAFESGRYVEAIDILRSLLRNEKELKDPAKIYVMLGEAYFANNEFTRAIQAFEAAEDISDVDPALKRQAQFQKAWILYRNQAYEQAQPIFEQVYTEVPATDLGAEALFWSADSYYRTEKYGPASTRFEMFIINYPDNEMIGAAQYSLGWSYFLMQEFDKATKPLEDFLADYNPPPIALFPYDTDTQLRIGDAYYAQGKYKEAMEFYNKAIGAEPGGDYAMFQVANSYYRSNRTFQAVNTFRRVLRIYPFSKLREQAQYNVAYIYLNTDNYEQAIEEFQAVINKYPNTEWAARSQYNIGDSYYNAGEYDKAIDSYKKVLDDYPRSQYIIDAVNGIQYSQLSSTGMDNSSDVLEEFLDDNPNSTTADRLRYRQAENVYQSGDYEGAIKEFKQYLRITNSDNLVPVAYSNLADAYKQLNRIDEAMEAYQNIVDEFPNHEQTPPALTALGSLSYENNKYGEAYKYYNKLLDTAPSYRQEAYVGMGNASLAQGNTQNAVQEFEEALKINPQSAGAKVGKAKIDIANREYANAVDVLSDIAQNNNTEIGAEAQYYLGKIEQDQENYEAALEAYSKVRVLFEAYEDWVSKSLYATAECHIRLGNRGEAIQILQGIEEKYPNTESAEKAGKLLKSSGN